MTKRISINILVISLIGILLVPITGSAHEIGGQNPPEKVHKVIEVLYDLDPEDVHDKVTHDFNHYGKPRWFAARPCDGYEGGHSGYDVIHEDDNAPFYSLTDGEVIEVVHPNPDNIKKLSYLAVYNATHNKTVLYLHPSKIDVEKGDPVKVGTTRLGRQGDTGFSTEPHVHLEIRAGEWKNPSCGANPILPEHRHHPNEDPIPFLYEHVKDFNRGADNNRPDLVEPEKVHKVIEVLYGLDPEDVHDEVAYDFNNYGNRPHNNPALCDGYEGGHSGYDVAHEDDDAPFYSLTDGEVINVKHPTNDIRDLSYISIYNATYKKTVFYLHPSDIDIRIGRRVEVGEYLGKQGNTGNSTNPHVHLEVRKGRSKLPSCGIAAAERTDRPNEDPIPFLYDQVKDFNQGADNNRPDLVIESIEPEGTITLEPGESFRISSTLKNQGTEESKETTLGYYRSADDRISSNDRLIKGPFVRRALAPDDTIRKGTRINAPTTPGTYYYGTCVDAVDNELDIANNCSEAVRVIVRSEDVNDADVDGNGIVDVEDLVLVAKAYGEEGDNDADVDDSGIVDIKDLILVAEAIDDAADAPAIRPQMQTIFTQEQLRELIAEVKVRKNISPSYQKGLALLEQIFRLAIPKKTALLANYPNPFNPETWIPYQLAKPAEVRVRIYSADGRLIRTLALGHQPAGIYQSRSRAAYWDGKNELGEPVASGVYFYTLTAGEFTATRKMLIRK